MSLPTDFPEVVKAEVGSAFLGRTTVELRGSQYTAERFIALHSVPERAMHADQPAMFP